jgi:hypothetical protein
MCKSGADTLCGHHICSFLVCSSVIPSGSDANVQCWSATCTFDVCNELHSFSATSTHSQMTEAMEALSQQMLEQPILWKMTWNCLMQELKSRRHQAGTGGGQILPFIVKDSKEIASVEREEAEVSVRSEREIQQKLSSNPVLHLDSLLSSLTQPPMIYSCEQVRIASKQGRRMVWSVAAALPTGLNIHTDQDLLHAYSATSLKETKVSAGCE